MMDSRQKVLSLRHLYLPMTVEEGQITLIIIEIADLIPLEGSDRTKTAEEGGRDVGVNGVEVEVVIAHMEEALLTDMVPTKILAKTNDHNQHGPIIDVHCHRRLWLSQEQRGSVPTARPFMIAPNNRGLHSIPRINRVGPSLKHTTTRISSLR